MRGRGRGFIIKIYHVATDKSSAENEALKQVKPERLLLSYFYFRNKPLDQFIEKIGYTPEIFLDSGAYSAYTKGKGIALTDYLRYISDNQRWIKSYFSLDVMFDSLLSYRYYQIMKEKQYNPIPVFHYGEPLHILQRYAEHTDFIALGGTVPEQNKSKVAEWTQGIIEKHPEIKFHLLGSSSRKIIDTCDLYSCDSSTWIMGAFNGYPKHIKGTTREAKIERAVFNLQKELELC